MADSDTKLRIEPPTDSGWKVHSRRGLLRYNDTPEGRLVLLADIVRWLAKSRELPLAVAVEQVCAKLEGEHPPLLYDVDETEWAKPGNTLSGFVQFTPEAKEFASLPPAVIYAKLKARNLRASLSFGNLNDFAGADAAVDFAAAHDLWSWGLAAEVPSEKPGKDDVTDIDSLCMYWKQFNGTPDQRRPPWIDEHKKILRDAVAAYGRGGIAHYAGELGVSSTRVGQLIAEPETAPEDAPSNKAPETAHGSPNDILRNLGKDAAPGYTSTQYDMGRAKKSA